MPARVLQQGIEAMQRGSRSEGARLIRIAVKDPALGGDLRCIGLIWLAEVAADAAERQRLLQQALAADPASADARTRLARAMTSGLPAGESPAATPPASPQPAPAAPPAASGRQLNLAEHIASIVGGPVGAGTAFFVSADGLLATSRSVIGARDRVTAELHDGRSLTAQVVRSFPEFDLALLRSEARPPFVMTPVPEAQVPEEAALFVFHYTGDALSGAQRPTRRLLAAHWIPTTFRSLQDAGGGPIFDARGLLAGMITRNTSQTSDYLYGLHIHAIRACVERLQSENGGARRAYCPDCGAASVAAGMGYFYCEACGATLAAAAQVARYPAPQAAAMYDPGTDRCVQCASASGIFQGRCLRCGAAQA